MNSSLKKFNVALILLVVLALSSVQIPRALSVESTAQDKALSFLADVVKLDMTKYNVKLVSYGMDYPSYLGGFARETVHYTLDGADGNKLSMVSMFANNSMCYCTLSAIKGSPLYAQPQPAEILDTAKNLIDNYYDYAGASYFQAMRNMLSAVNELKNTTITVSNLKLAMSTGNYVQINWMYTADGIDFPIKGIGFMFRNGYLSAFWNNWPLYKIGGTSAISKEEAISIAMENAENYSMEISLGPGNTTGVKPNIVDKPVDAMLITGPRETLTLYPAWTVQLYFDKVYYTYYGIQVRLWADTKQIIYCHLTGTGGGSMSGETPESTTTEPSLTPQPSPTQPNSLPATPPSNNPPAQPRSFLGSSLPVEYCYGIIATTVVAIAIATGYLYLKRKK